tara:strand:- start:284 stop:391 length:108 start_codon:yes stop_codon:yes gene_type:complete
MKIPFWAKPKYKEGLSIRPKRKPLIYKINSKDWLK